MLRDTRLTSEMVLLCARTNRRHVVLPPDIAKLLPKGRLLSEVRERAMADDARAERMVAKGCLGGSFPQRAHAPRLT